MTRQRGYETKKDRIALGAWTLFMREGYGATSVDAILQQTGISKGTFYHYYHTKGELLQYTVERLYGAAWEQVRQIAFDSQSAPIVRLNRITRATFQGRGSQPADAWAVVRATYSDRNLPLRNLLDRRTEEEVSPALSQLLAEGCESGEFSLTDVGETSALILRLAHAQKAANARTLIECADPKESKRIIVNRLARFVEAVERILGAAEGSLERLDASFLDAILAARERDAAALCTESE